MDSFKTQLLQLLQRRLVGQFKFMHLIEIACSTANPDLRQLRAILQAADNWLDVDRFLGPSYGARQITLAAVDARVFVICETPWDKPVSKFETAQG